MKRKKLSPTMPGEILLHEFLKPMKISQYKLAKAIQVSQIRISQIIKGNRAITPDTALRLSRYFGTSPELWMDLQTAYDLKIAARDSGEKIEAGISPRAA